MERIYCIKVIKATACFLRDIFYNTARCCFQSFIAFEPVTQNKCVFRNTVAEDFLQFLRCRFGTVYRSRYCITFTLYTGTNADVFVRDPSFLCFCAMFTGLRQTEAGSSFPL